MLLLLCFHMCTYILVTRYCQSVQWVRHNVQGVISVLIQLDNLQGNGANHSSFLWIIVSCSSIHFLLYIYHFNDTGCSLNIDLFSKNSRKFPTSPSPALGFGWLYSDVGEGGVAVYCKKKQFFLNTMQLKSKIEKRPGNADVERLVLEMVSMTCFHWKRRFVYKFA